MVAQAVAQAAMAFFACGSKELPIFFGCSGGFAARTTEINGSFRPAGGQKRRSQSPPRKAYRQRESLVDELDQVIIFAPFAQHDVAAIDAFAGQHRAGLVVDLLIIEIDAAALDRPPSVAA